MLLRNVAHPPLYLPSRKKHRKSLGEQSPTLIEDYAVILNGTLADEAEILRLCLSELGIGSKQVVHAYTTLGLARASSPEELEQTGRSLRTNLKRLDEETLDDFLAKNKEPHLVAPALILGGQLIPVTDEQLREVFRDNNGWQRFRELYPESMGNVSFSRVGFNIALTQALVYAGQQVDWLMGHGAYWLLQKKENRWKKAGSAMAWIS